VPTQTKNTKASQSGHFFGALELITSKQKHRMGTFIEEAMYFEALKIMIQNGADVLLPRNWLSDAAYFNAFNAFGGDSWLDEVSDERLWRRFPNTTPAIRGNTRSDTFYAVSDLLERFRDRFGLSLDTLKTLVLQREAQSLASAPSSEAASSNTHGVRFLRITLQRGGMTTNVMPRHMSWHRARRCGLGTWRTQCCFFFT